MVCAAEKIQLFLETDVIHDGAGQQLQSVYYFVHIVDNQLLGTKHGALIQA